MTDPQLYRKWYMWLGSEADEAAAEAETLDQLIRELPGVDESGEDG